MSEYRQISFDAVALLLGEAAGVCSGRKNTGVALHMMSLRSYRSPLKNIHGSFQSTQGSFLNTQGSFQGRQGSFQDSQVSF